VVLSQPVRALAIESPPTLAEPIDAVPEPTPVGRDTVRLIRSVRWQLHKTPQRMALVALAAAAAFAWFSPPTRVPTRAAWHRAGTQVQIMLERVLPNHELRP
jgi:hypothetical protein